MARRSSELIALVLAAALAMAASSPAAGQEQPAPLARLEIALWPEFDRQAVLVIYRFELPAGTATPATVALPLPAKAGEPHAVAWQDESGNLLLAQYSRRVEGEWATVLVESESLIGQVEYYAELDIDGDERTFGFDWPGGVEIMDFAYEVQQPVNSSGFRVSPAPDREGQGAFGLTYAFGQLGQLAASEAISIQLRYLKADALLSLDSVQQSPPQPALSQPEAPPREGPDLAALLPWVVGLGIVLVVVGVIWYVRLSRAVPARPRAPRKAARRKARGRGEIEASPVYCHQCGTKAAASDVFCRQCGTKLRR